ncbi:hypothetical protein J6590_027553 [Homalodisca vitripennis]|nr:hypothetical protein J6590_027553 [Homalodisca vitripennis]
MLPNYVHATSTFLPHATYIRLLHKYSLRLLEKQIPTTCSVQSQSLPTIYRLEAQSLPTICRLKAQSLHQQCSKQGGSPPPPPRSGDLSRPAGQCKLRPISQASDQIKWTVRYLQSASGWPSHTSTLPPLVNPNSGRVVCANCCSFRMLPDETSVEVTRPDPEGFVHLRDNRVRGSAHIHV